MTKQVQLCDELFFFQSKPVSQCTHPAKYRYQVTRFKVEYLCGVHARRFKDSPNLKPIEEKNSR